MSVNEKFSLDYPHYDPSSVMGRLRNNFAITNPALLLLSSEEIMRRSQTIDDWKLGKPEARSLSDSELWYNRTVKESSVHPDTGEIIPQPFRMCGYTAYGTPIVFSVLLPVTAKSLFLTGLTQWMNQSHNAAVNWANRSVAAGAGDPKWDILRGYTAASTSAVGISMGSNILVDRMNVTPATRVLLKRYTPFPACAVASITNMVMMRLPELQRGITVLEDGEPLGSSKVAAQQAISSTAMVRGVLVAFAILSPQILYAGCERVLNLPNPKRAAWRLPAQLACTVTGFGLGVPISLSCFTQHMSLPVQSLEPELQAKAKNKQGTVVFNKGL